MPAADVMKFESVLCLAESNAQLTAGVADRLAGTPVDLAVAFVRAPAGDDAQELLRAIGGAVRAKHFLACTAQGVIGGGHEIEDHPAVALVAGTLPGALITSFALGQDDWPKVLDDNSSFKAAIGVGASPKVFVLLVDPFSTPLRELLAAFDACFPGVPVVGGVASGGGQPGTNALAGGGGVRRDGAVGLAIAGNVRVEVVVSQGCRPIGELLSVTGGDRNIINSLDGKAALEVLRGIYGGLDAGSQARAQRGMLIGIAAEGSGDDPGPSDFLIRNIAGADPASGAIAVTDMVHAGQRVRFHVRDAKTATDDLELLLSPQAFDAPPAAGLLFSCNGRGTGLYDYPDGDIRVVQKALGDGCPVAGFFCAGELGPIGSQNHVHGQTASLVIFRPSA